jgi:hypothetical protein
LGDKLKVKFKLLAHQQVLTIDNFIEFAKNAHIVIIHLMGDLPEMDRLLFILKSSNVPFLVASVSNERNQEYQLISTVK